MEKRACPKCGIVCAGYYICLQCTSVDPQHAQRMFEEVLERERLLLLDLRDKFAMAALTAVAADEAPGEFFTNMAYEWADLMLKSRLPESG